MFKQLKAHNIKSIPLSLLGFNKMEITIVLYQPNSYSESYVIKSFYSEEKAIGYIVNQKDYSPFDLTYVSCEVE